MFFVTVFAVCNNLRELFYDRTPGDARVKVGSERQAASRQREGGARSGFTIYYLARGVPPKLALLAGKILRKSSSGQRPRGPPKIHGFHWLIF